jgi:Fur family ferric uptake transcriptional regulator
MPDLEALVEQFREHGYKMTPQRRAIIQVIAGCTSLHPTAEQIHDRVTEQMPDISLATVYNTLRELVAIDQIFELNLGLGTRHYELCREEHAHLVCLQCGKIRDVPGDLGVVMTRFHRNNGFRAVRHDVTIFGYCAGCDPART